jgi:hypothetical protein
MATITAVDGGDPFGPIGSIHPRAKQLVGRRHAAGARGGGAPRRRAAVGPRGRPLCKGRRRRRRRGRGQ